MKNIIIIIGIFLSANTTMAQQVDQQKMNKDLKVAHTVLKSLAFEDEQVFLRNDRGQEEAQYIEGFGVILTLPASSFRFYNFNMDMPPMPPMPDFSEAIAKGMAAVEKLEYTIEEEEEEVDTEQRRAEMEQRRAELQQRQAELEQRAQTLVARVNTTVFNSDSLREVKQAETVNNIKSFLLDYGHLITQLKDSDKILVMERGHEGMFYRVDGRVERSRTNRLSVEANVKDISAFQAGKISREEAEKRIEVNLGDKEKALPKDLALFQSIMQRLYKPDLSETYYLSSRLPYEQIEGLGTIFYMDVVSSIPAGNNLWNIPTQNEEGLTQEERDNLIKRLYPQFEANLKSNVLEYGKNISTLEGKEQLIFKVAITKCSGCGIPKTLELQVSGETLKKLKAGEITEQLALEQIKSNTGTMQ